MKKELKDKYREAAANPGKTVSLGEIVVCDFCCKDYTDSKEPGGLIFDSKACCPECSPRLRQSIEKYNEQSYIRATCPGDKAFADFVREYRGPDSGITVYGDLDIF